MMRCLFLGLVLFLPACSGPTKPPAASPAKSDELSELPTILINYSGQHGKGPMKPTDLAPFEAGAPLAYRSLLSGALVLVPGAMMPGEGDLANATEAIVAYEKDTPTAGGFVLRHNGKVVKLTAEEFKSAKLFGK
jgi:hypothetical protein